MISFITVGRDDDYGKNFLQRMHMSVSKNIDAIEKFGVPYEYLVVEWCPVKKYLIHNELFENLFRTKNLVDIVIKPEVSQKEQLDPVIFYEYFAKTAGIRTSRYDLLVILNADIVVPETTMQIIADMARNGFNASHYYRPLYRVKVDDNLNTLKRTSVHRPKSPDAVVCGYYAGDFLVASREAIIR